MNIYCKVCGAHLKQWVGSVHSYSEITGEPKKYYIIRRCPNWQAGYFGSNGHYMRIWKVSADKIINREYDGSPPPKIFCDTWSGY